MANTLFPNDTLQPGAQLASDEVFDFDGDAGHFFKLVMQQDGNLVLYRHDNGDNTDGVQWASNTAGKAVSECIMQDDGNLVVYSIPPLDPSSKVWASNDPSKYRIQPMVANSYAVMQDDGNFVIYPPGSNSANGTATFATNTVTG